MGKRQKIVYFIVGTLILLIALFAITYAYFTTQIVGNTNDNSLHITTAELLLVYGDGTTEILIGEEIMPGTVVATKDFTVTNKGETFIDEYQVYLENVINDFLYSEHVRLRVTCNYKKTDGTTGVCNGFGIDNNEDGVVGEDELGYYPKTNTKLISNSIAKDEVHMYNLSVEYIESNSEQSVDMGKTLKGKVQIYDPKDVITIKGTVTNALENYYVELHSNIKTSQIINGSYEIHGVEPGEHTLYIKNLDQNGVENTIASKKINITKGSSASISSDGSKIVITDDTDIANINISVSSNAIILSGINISEHTTLASKIISSAKKGSGERTVYSKNPVSHFYNASGENEKTLSEQLDRYTYSTNKNSYYFRGNVIDNYVEFNNMCFRAVRIEGDGSIKLILAAEKKCSEITENDTKSGLIYNGSYFSFGNNYSLTSEIYEVYDSSYIKKALDTWYLESGIINKQYMLKKDTWCLGGNKDNMFDNTVSFYEGYSKNVTYGKFSAGYRFESNTVSLVCEYEDSIQSFIGSLTMDEVVLAGGSLKNNSTYYLSDNANSSDYGYWTLSVASLAEETKRNHFIVNEKGKLSIIFDVPLDRNEVNGEIIDFGPGVRPAITLKADTLYTLGDGTIKNPYIVN